MVKRLFFALLLLVLIFGGIAAWKYRQIQQMTAQMSQPQPPATVASTEVTTEAWRPRLKSVGNVVAVNGIDVTTEVAGKVSRVAFASASRVSRGDVLLELDAAVDKAALEGLRAERRLAQLQFERAADLLPKRSIPQSDYDEAKARLESATAAVAEQEARLANKVIRAPFDGLLGLRRVDTGEYVSPGATIVSLQALDPLYVDYALPERYLDDVRPGFTVEVEVDAWPEQTFEGEISAIDSKVNEATRSITVRATLPNPGDLLRPGMFADVSTLMPDTREVLTVPRTAISFNTYGDYVFVIREGEGGELTVERRQVETGSTRNGRVAVTSGLEAGERLVRAGLVKLRNGQRVQVDNSVALDDTLPDGP